MKIYFAYLEFLRNFQNHLHFRRLHLLHHRLHPALQGLIHQLICLESSSEMTIEEKRRMKPKFTKAQPNVLSIEIKHLAQNEVAIKSIWEKRKNHSPISKRRISPCIRDHFHFETAND